MEGLRRSTGHGHPPVFRPTDTRLLPIIRSEVSGLPGAQLSQDRVPSHVPRQGWQRPAAPDRAGPPPPKASPQTFKEILRAIKKKNSIGFGEGMGYGCPDTSLQETAMPIQVMSAAAQAAAGFEESNGAITLVEEHGRFHTDAAGVRHQRVFHHRLGKFGMVVSTSVGWRPLPPDGMSSC